MRLRGRIAGSAIAQTPAFRTDKRGVDLPFVAPVARAGRYLTFGIARHEFAIEAAYVRGIIPAKEMEAVQALNAGLVRFFGRWMCGFACLRGRDFPVIDLRAKLGLEPGRRGRQPCVVAVEVLTPEGPSLAGFVADRISEMVEVRERDLRNGKLLMRGRQRLVLDPSCLFRL